MHSIEVSDMPELRPRQPSIHPLDLWNCLWTGSSVGDAIESEQQLLKRFVHSPWQLGRVRVDLPKLGIGKQYINTLVVNPDVAHGTPIVWTHGAGAGLGFGYRNFDPLANPKKGAKRRLIAFDWLGQAGSSRPSYPYGGVRPSWTLSHDELVSRAIDFSVESLEAWREQMHLDEFDLIAHSMGGYLASHYAMRYPERVRRLVLISPVGWAEMPKGELAKARASGMLGFLWDSKLGNFGLAKLLGRSVRTLAKNAVVGRFGIRDEEERRLVSDYFWDHLTSQPISAEMAVNYLLVPFVPPAPFGFYARRPVSTEDPQLLAMLPPTTLLYGSHDLHYIPTMPEAVTVVQQAARSPVTMRHVAHSDHHLYLDNPRDFHAEVERALA